MDTSRCETDHERVRWAVLCSDRGALIAKTGVLRQPTRLGRPRWRFVSCDGSEEHAGRVPGLTALDAGHLARADAVATRENLLAGSGFTDLVHLLKGQLGPTSRTNVLSLGHDLKVIRTDAASLAAKVIER